MKFRFLGTAAAEGIPALWCECDVCRQAFKQRGKDLRRRASYLIDSDTMIDFGPDGLWQAMEYNIDLTGLKRVLFTHPHGDHLDPMAMLFRKNGNFGLVTRMLDIIGGDAVFGTIMSFTALDCNFCDFKEMMINPIRMYHGQEYRAENDDFAALALNANHAPGKSALVYVIRRGGKSIFIGNDTGWLSDASWELLSGCKLDMVLLDSTCGIGVNINAAGGHMGGNTVVRSVEKMRQMGVLNPSCQVFATHFSHNGAALHEDLQKFFSPHGIEVAYDGLEIEL